MAHVDLPGTHWVGRYGVDVGLVEPVAVAALDPDRPGAVVLVDEIGRMECLAPGFVRAMRRLLDSPRPVVATVALRGAGLIAEAKSRPDVDVWNVSPGNRDRLPGEVLRWLRGRGLPGGPGPG